MDTYVGLILNAIAILLLLVCSGLLSGSEVAYFSLSHKDKQQLWEEPDTASNRILKLIDTPRYLLSTILIANNVVNIAIILFSDSVIKQIVPSSLGETLNFLITVVLVTFLLVLFGEVAPKVYANKNNVRIARFMSLPLFFMGMIFKPLGWVLVNSTGAIEKRLAKTLSQSAISTEDINSAIELTIKDSEFAEQDMDILKGIIRFGNTSASEVLKPRMKVVAIDINSSFEEVVKVFQEEAYSRIPVYSEDLDSIKGILHAKDLLELIRIEDKKNWPERIREAFFIPKEKKIDDLFQDFQEKRTHMAIVVDEYGGTYGIVTMEDILEEIVGEIQDEFDQSEDEIFDKVDDYTYDFDGGTTLGEITKVLDVSSDFFDDQREGAETIAGLVLVLNGRIPPVNTFLSFKEHRIIILATSKRRIEKVRIILPSSNTITDATV
jgi:gliding motility-associated protein GldE